MSEIKEIGRVGTFDIEKNFQGVGVSYYSDKSIVVEGFYDSWQTGACSGGTEEFTLKEFLTGLGITLQDVKEALER